ncbi:MAG: GNAT family N-acetyltransferase [Betaproteobacteria bacterium]
MPDIALLHTTRLLLRRPEPGDAAAYFAIFGDPATNRFNAAPPLEDLAAARDALAQRLAHWEIAGHGLWAIAAREHPGDLIGFGGLSTRHFDDVARTNLGFRFAPSAWGRGLASELACFSVNVGWHLLQLDEIWAVVHEDHAASRRVLEKAGMAAVARVLGEDGRTHDLRYRLLSPYN